MSRPAISLLLGLVLVPCAACSRDATAPAGSLPETVTVTAGLHPDISWTPGGPVVSITVAEKGGGAILWSARGERLTNAIRPAVGYGTTPPHAIATANITLPLTAGTRYTVELYRADADGVSHLVGSTTFRP